MSKCEICGKPQKDDLFSFVTKEPVCSICAIKYAGASPVSKDTIKKVRDKLGLQDGEYLNQDNAEEARKILGK